MKCFDRGGDDFNSWLTVPAVKVIKGQDVRVNHNTIQNKSRTLYRKMRDFMNWL